MTEKQAMSAEDLAVELLTSRQHVTGGRPEALRLLGELRDLWGRQIAARQRVAHDEMRPYAHMGQPCRPEYDCHVSKVIALAEEGA